MGALIYPEAQGEADKYQNVMNTINNAQPIIDKVAAADTHYNIKQSNFTDAQGNLYQDYYATYEGKVSEWTSEAKGLSSDFTTFKTAMSSCYSFAEEQQAMWASRIGLRYPDPPPDDSNS